MDTFKTHLRRQLAAHPAMEPQDVVKLCYQAAHGAEHLLRDPAYAQKRFQEEFAATEPLPCPLFEPISEEVGRVNLSAWKAENLPPEWLFRMFLGTATLPGGGEEKMEACLLAAGEVLKETSHPAEAGWEEFLAAYRQMGMPALRHSEGYRAKERPAYRIVSEKYGRLIPQLIAIANGDDLSVSEETAEILSKVTGIALGGAL